MIRKFISAAFFVVLFAWLGWWDAILNFVPHLSARANMGFYLVFSTSLLTVWLSALLVFDRFVYWSVRPGQLVEQHLVGGSSRSYDTNGLRFEKREQDYFRHLLLGLGNIHKGALLMSRRARATRRNDRHSECSVRRS